MFSPNKFWVAPLPIENQNDLCLDTMGDLQDVAIQKVESIIDHSQKLQEDLKKLGCKIKHHEDNLKFLKNLTNNLDESILDMQVTLGKYHSSSAFEAGNRSPNCAQNEQQTIEQILQLEKAASGVLCQLKVRHGRQAAQMPLTKDVLGIVAILGSVPDDNLSRILSEYLGLENMLAIVCKTYEGVKALEMYDREGQIDKGAGIHGLGHSIGRPVDGRFLIICLEELGPYVGEFVADDPQKKLELRKPRLPNGEFPRGFLGFAVNMINVDNMHLSYVTASGHGLRETLFYSLFSRLQVYKTRAEMLLARPCITEGAVSLDGGMIKSRGMFSLGSRKEVEVKFAISSRKPNHPDKILETEEQLKLTTWEKERIYEDMQREQALLQHARSTFDFKKDEFMKFLSQSSPTSPTSPFLSQRQVHPGQR